jgi:hypothetical protein
MNILNRNEQTLVLLLADRLEQDNSDWISSDDVAQQTGISEPAVRRIFGRIYDKNLGVLTQDGTKVHGTATCIDVAREIRRRRAQRPAPPDWVARLERWAKSKRGVAVIIVFVKVAGPIVGLVGGLLGCLAYLRG